MVGKKRDGDEPCKQCHEGRGGVKQVKGCH